MSGPVRLTEVEGFGISETTTVFKITESGARGPKGPGLPTNGLIDQMIRKTSSVVDFATEWFTLTKDFIGLGNVTDDAQLKRSAGDFLEFTEKTNLTTGDLFIIEDSEDDENKKRGTLGSIFLFIKSLFDFLYLKRDADDYGTFDQKASIVDADRLLIEDSEDSLGKKWILKSLLDDGGGGSEWTEVARTEVTSAVSTVEFIDVFTNDFDVYRVLFSNIGVVTTSGATFRMVLGHGVGPTYITAGYYYHINNSRSNSSSYSSQNAANAAFFALSDQILSGSIVYGFSGEIVLENIRDSTLFTVVYSTGTTVVNATLTGHSRMSGALHNIVSVLDSVKFFPSGGTFAQGTIVIEGKNL